MLKNQVAPLFNVDEELGSVAKFIKAGTRFYILPLTVDYEKSKIHYSFFSFRSLLSWLVISLPFMITVFIFKLQD